MPAHWFYRIENIREAFNGGLRGYQAAPHPHPESFMMGMSYQPDPRGTLSLPSQSRSRREYQQGATFMKMAIADPGNGGGRHHG
ncbi:MAG: hypothetical protein VCA37_18505 [Roseibacillus sp.]